MDGCLGCLLLAACELGLLVVEREEVVADEVLLTLAAGLDADVLRLEEFVEEPEWFGSLRSCLRAAGCCWFCAPLGSTGLIGTRVTGLATG
jgi:hypothetical protein